MKISKFIKNKIFASKSDRGFTLFISILITGTLLLISMAIISLSVKEAFLTGSARESQYAFYAADTGAECAIYWDVKNPSGITAFSTTTGSTIFCNKDSLNATNPTPSVVGGSWNGSTGVSNFTLTFLPQPYCTKVTVTKYADLTTKIESLGYNTCDTSNPRRVERAVRVTY